MQREQGQWLTLDTAEFNAKQQLLRKVDTKMLKDTTQNEDIEINNVYKTLYTFAKLRREN